LNINRLVKFYLLITFIVCTSLVAKAFHLVGGELTYECLNAEEGIYLVKLSLYRDCNCDENYDCTDFDGVANITIFNGEDGFIKTEQLSLYDKGIIKPNIEGLCLETVPDICIESSIGYEKKIKLPPSVFGYKIVYQRCCRNSTIVNIKEANKTGSTYQIVIPSSNLATCNSSPVFKKYPPIVICAGFPLEFDYSATDADSDSLVYELCNPLKGASKSSPNPVTASQPPYEPVDWKDGFNINNQIGSNPQIIVDSETGYLQGTPLRAGQYVVGICVKEYRNNILISTMARDFQFNVADCGIVKAKIKADQIKEDGTFVIQQCNGYGINFLNESIGAQNYIWNFGDPNSFDDFSLDRNSFYEYTDTGKYFVQLIADPNETCKDTAMLQLNMYPTEKPDFSWTGGCNDEPVQFIDLSVTDFGNITNWQWLFGGNNWGATQQNPIINVDNRSTIDVELNITTDLGCKLSTTKTLDLDIVPTPILEHSKLCLNTQPIQFTDLSTISSGSIVDWKWIVYDENLNELYNTNTKQMQYIFDVGTYFVNLEIISNNGCSNSIQQPITLFENFEIDAGIDIEICENKSFEINLKATSTVDYFEWLPFSEVRTSYNEKNNPVIEPKKSDTYFISAYDLNGCIATDTFELTLHKAPQVNIGNDTLICYRQQVFLQPNVEDVYNSNLTYQWTYNTFLSNLDQFNQYVSPDTSSTFYLTVTESAHNCSTIDSVFIKVDNQVNINIINDTIVCPGSTVNLFASGGDTYSWYNNQQLLANDAEFEITVTKNTAYNVNVANSCFNAESIVNIDVFDLPFIDAGNDMEIEVGKSYNLNPVFDEQSIVNFFWSSDKDYLSEYTEKYIAITPYEDSWYAINAVTNNNCLASDTINILVKNMPDVYLPNAFSPNGDNINDVIVPVLKGIKKLNTFSIYNRYGEKIFQTNSSEVSWDGTYDNKPLAMGVYVYFINGLTYFNEPFSKKGNITLIK